MRCPPPVANRFGDLECRACARVWEAGEQRPVCQGPPQDQRLQTAAPVRQSPPVSPDAESLQIAAGALASIRAGLTRTSKPA